MRLFVTGASGFIGSRVVPELLDAGHEVVGLARSDASAAALTAAGAQVRRGDLLDPDGLRAAADEADGVVHLAFLHDFSQFEENQRTDRRVVDLFGDVLAGSDRPLVIASGLVRFDTGRPGVADEPMIRRATAAATVRLAERGIRSVVLGLPPTVHGAGDRGFIHRIVEIAREKGVSGYVGDGAHAWSAVHRDDAARLFRLAVDKAEAGTVLHAVADSGVATRDIAEAVGRRLGVPTTSIDPADAVSHFGWLGMMWSMPMTGDGGPAAATVGWAPSGPTLLADLAERHYFQD
ncbi:SDR family oxidoreductase [Nocardia sp. NPDC004860]|uniref:SDR family oxidoreductase n=1 Tax=Nocardia sp. NPDC004860 TaxID=3154557 RepID=UPI0033B6F602